MKKLTKKQAKGILYALSIYLLCLSAVLLKLKTEDIKNCFQIDIYDNE